jgi:hypothetical protein
MNTDTRRLICHFILKYSETMLDDLVLSNSNDHDTDLTQSQLRLLLLISNVMGEQWLEPVNICNEVDLSVRRTLGIWKAFIIVYWRRIHNSWRTIELTWAIHQTRQKDSKINEYVDSIDNNENDDS